MPSLAIVPCLWFDSQAEAAAEYYTAIFPNSRIVKVTRYPGAGEEVHGQAEGSAMSVEFELDGQRFTALNGGPHFTFNEAISFEVRCETQEEIDYFWERLGAEGDEAAQQCGWLKDKFGLSWQVVPTMLNELSDGDAEAGNRLMAAILGMKKLDIAELQRAYAG